MKTFLLFLVCPSSRAKLNYEHVCPSVSNSFTNVHFVCLIWFKIKRIRNIFVIKNVFHNIFFVNFISNLYISGPRATGQHSAPRGGPPRSWTNDDLTKALEMVWNKRMTTSQASRVFGIPYNSLLMYVRGKYGKSLRLDVLKKNTPAANDNLNTIGNSRLVLTVAFNYGGRWDIVQACKDAQAWEFINEKPDNLHTHHNNCSKL